MEHATPPASNASESPSERGSPNGSPSPVRADGGSDRERDHEAIDTLRRALRALPALAPGRLRTDTDGDESSDGSLDGESDRARSCPPTEEASDADVRRAIEAVE